MSTEFKGGKLHKLSQTYRHKRSFQDVIPFHTNHNSFVPHIIVKSTENRHISLKSHTVRKLLKVSKRKSSCENFDKLRKTERIACFPAQGLRSNKNCMGLTWGHRDICHVFPIPLQPYEWLREFGIRVKERRYVLWRWDPKDGTWGDFFLLPVFCFRALSSTDRFDNPSRYYYLFDKVPLRKTTSL